MKKSTRNLLIALLLILIFAGIAAYRMWNKPHRNPADEKGIAFTSTEILERLRKNPADPDVLDKTVEISGLVKDVEKTDSSAVVVLEIPGQPDASVRAALQKSELAKTADIQGKEIKVKGFCSGIQSLELMEGLKTEDVQVRDALLP